ncbi:Xaa-Pro aminopeptidase [Rhizobium sp. SJZ105]|uniref:M24 family metallopeptidase n=1 Tax=Rhizobium sp. SJZ105 TaxID=2572678 RepID=UPI00119E9133|nr:M24 family metallopeptidase [Rhizobium sp. SJZ105]TWC76375.1 Xaa-Pro aminopeptidase [Rhizobium sp. SJZ105]
MKTNSPISSREMERRWEAVRRIMDAQDIDVILMQAKEDWMGGYVRWFTDVPAGNGYPRTVLFFRDRPMIVVEMGAFDTVRQSDPSAQATLGVQHIYGTPSFHSVGYTVVYDTELVIRALHEGGARRVATLVPAALPYSLMQAVSTAFDLVDLTEEIDRVKAIKSPEEIGLIRQIALMQDRIFSEVLDFVRPGVTDRDVASHAEAVGLKLGADQGIYFGLSAPQGRPSRFLGRHYQRREMGNGDHFSILIEVNGPGGLYLEIARTIVLGSAGDHILAAFDNVKAAQDHTLDLIRPGAMPAEIAIAHDRWMVERGLPPEMRLYAHGQGCDMVERPLLRKDETMPLAENMCLAVHPGYDDGRVFAVICDNYMIGATKVGDCLHRTQKQIFEV